MDNTALSDLIRQFGESLDLPQLELDELNCCWLTFDDVLVCLEADENADKLLLYAPVADLPATDREALLVSLLQANLFWRETGGGTLAVSTETQQVILQLPATLSAQTAASLGEMMDGFVTQCEHWSSKMAEMVANQETDASLNTEVFAVGQLI